MKRESMVIYLTTIITFVVFLFSTTYAQDIEVKVEKDNVNFKNGAPFIDDSSRVQVPIRDVLEKMGAEVSWSSSENLVHIKKNDVIIKVPIGKGYLLKNNRKYFHDTEAKIINNRTYIPISPIAQALGNSIYWDDENKTVHITKNKIDSVAGATAKK